MAPQRVAAARLGLIFLAACAASEEPFEVQQSTPGEGDEVAPDVALSLRFSEPFDPDTCLDDAVYLGLIAEQGQLDAVVPFVVRVVDEQQLTLDSEPLWPGAWRLGVQSGRRGCLSQWGLGLVPFSVDFVVIDGA